jgi:autotransporter-associated beta strand protein
MQRPVIFITNWSRVMSTVVFRRRTVGLGVFFIVSGAVFSWAEVAGAQAIPLSGTGFTQNMVVGAGQTFTSSGISATMDGGTSKNGATWYQIGQNINAPSTGIPMSSTFTVADGTTGGDTFLMQNTSANNAILLASDGNGATSGTFTLNTPAAYTGLSFLASDGNGSANIALTLNYVGGATYSSTISVNDWFNNVSNLAYNANGRINSGGYDNVNNGNPKLFYYDLTGLSSSSNLQSISFNFLGGGTTHTAIFGVSGVAASTLTWNGGANNNWSLAGSDTNWTGGPAYTDGSNVLFSDGATTSTINIASTVQPASVTFNNNSSTYAFSGAAIAGTSSVYLTSGGNVTFNSANTYTGTTYIAGGSLTLGHPLAVQNSTVNVGPANGLTFSSGNTSPTIGGLSGPGSIALQDAGFNPVTPSVGANNASTVYTGALTGAGGLTKVGTGTLTVNNLSTYSGATTVAAGTLKLRAGIGAYRYYRWNMINDVSDGGGYQVSEIAFYSSGTNPSGGTRVAPVAAAGDGGFFGDQGLPGLYDNNVNTKAFMSSPFPRYVTFDFGLPSIMTGYDWASANDSTPARNPNNWQVLGSNDGANFSILDAQTGQGSTPTTTFTYAPGWSLSMGQAASAVSIAPGATLDLNGQAQLVTALNDYSPGSSGSIINSNTSNAGTLYLTASSGTDTFSGLLAGGGTLGTLNVILNGAGTFVFANTNTFTGETAILNGTLLLTKPLALQSSTVLVGTNNGLVFASGNNSPTIGGLAGNGNFSLQDTGGSPVTLNLNVSSGNTAASYAGNMSGTGGLRKTGPGNQILSGVNSFTGAITINAGTLTLPGGNNQSFLTGAPNIFVNGGGTLAFSNYNSFGLTPGSMSAVTVNAGGVILSSNTVVLYNNLTLNNGTASVNGNDNYGSTWGSFGFAGTTTATGNAAINVISGNGSIQNGNGNAGFGTFTVLTPAATDSLAISAPIESSVGLVKQGLGNLTLANGTTNYTGTTTVSAGTLTLQDTNNYASPTIAGNSTTLVLIRTGTGFAARGGSHSGITSSGVINANGAAGGLNGGWFYLEGTNNFTGTVNINSGVLQTDAGGSVLGSATVNIAPGAVMGLHATNLGWTIGGLNGAGDVTPAQAGQGSPAVLTVGAGNGSGSYAGIIHGNNTTGGTDGTIEAGYVNVVKTGSGLQTFSGSDTYSGTTVVSGGTLVAANDSALGAYNGSYGTNSNAVSMNPAASATLVFPSASPAIGSLASNGAGTSKVVLASSGAATNLTIGANGLSTSFAGSISDLSAGTPAAVGSVSKTGSGTLALAGNNTYTGATTILSGKLYLNGTNATPSISVPTGGTLGGSGSASAATATVQNNGAIEAGSNGVGSLTLAGLTFTNNGAVSVANFANYTSASAVHVTGNNGLSAQGNASSITFYLSGPAPTNTTPETAHLLQYSGAIQGSGLNSPQLNLSNVTGLSSRSSITLTTADPGFIDVNFFTDYPIWTGAGNGIWTTATQGPAYNWKLASNSAGTDFQTNDAVVFDDSAGANTTVSISGTGDVSPASVTFNNNLHNYLLQGTHGITGISALTMNGGAAVTISNSNGYTGGTVLNAGRLILANSAAIGSTASTLAINGGTIDNSSPLTMANYPIAWNGSFAFAGNNALNIGAGNVTLGSSAAVQLNNATPLTIGGTIAGTTGFAENGTGLLVLTGSSNYSGTTVVNGGTLGLGAGGSLGSASSVALATGTVFLFTGSGSPSAAATISGSGSVVQAGTGLATLSGSNSYTGGTSVSAGTLQGVWSSGGTWATFGTGPIVNNATLVLSRVGGGDPFFTQAITGTGTTILQSSVGNYINLATGAQFSASGDLTVQNTGLNVGLLSQSVGALNGSGGAILSNFGTGSVTLSVGNNNHSGAFSGSLFAGQGTINLVKNGTGTEVLGSLTSATTSGSSFTGDITVNGGTLIGAAVSNFNSNTTAFGTPSSTRNINVNAGGTLIFDAPNMLGAGFFSSNVPTLNINGGVVTNGDPAASNAVNNALNNVNLTGGTLAATTGQHPNGYVAGYGAWNINGTITSSGNSAITTTDPVYGTTMLSNGGAANGVTTFNVQSGVLAVSAPLVEDPTDGGVGGLRQTGAGTLILTAANTYSGNSTVNGGTLQLGDGAAHNGSVVGNIVNNSTVVFANPAAQLFRGAVSGGGSVVKTGPGTLSVTAQQTYTGPTLIAAGGVKLTSQASIAGFGSDTSGTASNSTWTINSTVITTPAITNGVLKLTDGINSEARTAFFNTPMPTTAPFTVNFVYHGVGGADGTAFVVQNDPRGLGAIGDAGGSLAYAGAAPITNSVGLGLDLYNGGGIYFLNNGSLGALNGTGSVNVSSQDPIAVTLSYDGSSSLSITLLDEANNHTFMTTDPVGNIASIVGSNSAYIGFTGATGGIASTQTIANFNTSLTYTTSNILPAGTALTMATGSSLDLNGGSQQVASLSGAGTILNSAGTLSALVVGDSTTTTFSGSITKSAGGDISLTKVGGGTLVLSGSNNFTAGTTVNDGDLIVTSASGLGDGSNLSVGDPGLLSTLGAPVVPAPVAVTAVPEPGTLMLLAAGVIAAAVGAGRMNRICRSVRVRNRAGAA